MPNYQQRIPNNFEAPIQHPIQEKRLLPLHQQPISLEGAYIYDGTSTPVRGSASDVYCGPTFTPRYPRRRTRPNALEIRAPAADEAVADNCVPEL